MVRGWCLLLLLLLLIALGVEGWLVVCGCWVGWWELTPIISVALSACLLLLTCACRLY